ncbi:AAA domain-containing protein [Cupriavidus basilensis]|uniref:AAA domain-containing protein n=1 Tax=Cupriavidus basilensis TaxID=68895 RepID=A0ABT6B3D4_9BURK|nr:AAA domain-containing protein [Cupriavidus basilensis]MDF3838481.1 AAA domain-containing protein [Cupriavidus basilensis]
MVSICVNGKDKTRQISDWKIWWDSQQGELMLTCRFPSGKSYDSPLSNCKIEPTEVVQGKLLSKKGGAVFSAVDRAVIYGGKYAVVQYRGKQKVYVMNADRIAFCPETTIKDGAIFRYFGVVAKAREERASQQDKPISKNVLRQLERVLPHEDTALHAYCSGQNRPRERPGSLIYPFGVNESQLMAVEQAFISQISLIEGPPGTGKTQTILNIIANIVLRGNTVAILSNNNAAVGNVYEKLGKVGLDYVVAKLGSEQNRTDFFKDVPAVPSETPAPAPAMDHIQAVLQKLKQHLHIQDAVARLQAEIDELTIEQRYLLQWQRENMVVAPVPLEKYRLSPRKSSDLMAYLAYLAANRIRLKDRIDLLLNFKILRTKPFDDWEKRKSVIYALQLHYYENALRDKGSALAAYRETLERGNFKALLDDLAAGSMAYLKHHLHQHVPHQEAFDSENYRTKFNEFVKRGIDVAGAGFHEKPCQLRFCAVFQGGENAAGRDRGRWWVSWHGAAGRAGCIERQHPEKKRDPLAPIADRREPHRRKDCGVFGPVGKRRFNRLREMGGAFSVGSTSLPLGRVVYRLDAAERSGLQHAERQTVRARRPAYRRRLPSLHALRSKILRDGPGGPCRAIRQRGAARSSLGDLCQPGVPRPKHRRSASGTSTTRQRSLRHAR